MIHEMTDTNSSEVEAELIRLRDEAGATTSGRVATLLVVTDPDSAERSIATAIDASHQHPARIIAVVPQPDSDRDALDAQIRTGSDSGYGSGEVIVLHPHGLVNSGMDTLITPLLLPDSPIVTWWPGEPPASPIGDALGALSARRITDVLQTEDPSVAMTRLASCYTRGDSDLTWTRLTNWRGLIAAAYETTPVSDPSEVTIRGDKNKPTVRLMREWLQQSFGCSVAVEHEKGEFGLLAITLHRADGDITLLRESAHSVVLTVPGSDTAQHVTMPLRTDVDLLSEELRRLDPDEVYGEVLVAQFPYTVEPSSFAADRPGPSDVFVNDKDALVEQSAQLAVDKIAEAVNLRGIAHIVMTGGRTGTAVAARIGELLQESSAISPSAIHVWWGDERFVPAKSDERNDRPAISSLATGAGIPVYNVHTMPSSDVGMGLDEAAAWYGQQLSTMGADIAFSDESDASFFDVVLLGMGEDGHVASLFPEHPDASVVTALAIPVRNSPKPPPERISLTWPMLNSTRHVVFLVAGQDKAEPAARAHAGIDPAATPASAVRGTVSTTWFLDPASAELLREGDTV